MVWRSRENIAALLGLAGTILTAILGGVFAIDLFGFESRFLQRWPQWYYGTHVKISDPTGALSVEVPREWRYTGADSAENLELVRKKGACGPDDADIDDNKEICGAALLASSTDPAKWWTKHEASGVYLAASRSFADEDFDEIVEMTTNAPEACESTLTTRAEKLRQKRREGEQHYKVTYRIWEECGENDGKFLVFVAKPDEDDSPYGVVGLQKILHDGDWVERRKTIETFEVDPKQLPD
jgi:hypothetical protein